MGKKDKRIDAYIDKSHDFAKPILDHLRALIHRACPEVEETIKWGFPHFCYHGIMCSMASFKQHCSFGFWKASLINDPERRLADLGEQAMGHMGRLTRLADLPSDKSMIHYIKEAAQLNEQGVKVILPPRPAKRAALKVPPYFKKELDRNKAALDTFKAFSYSHKKDYLEWITEAKTEETRAKRMKTTIEWLGDGKARNWKYEKSK